MFPRQAETLGLQVIIVGHHSRSAWIAQLQAALPGAAWIIDFADQGSTCSHRRALELAATLPERSIIMEDDAIPVRGFMSQAEDWARRFPDDLISFYLGTSRPAKWQPRVDKALRETTEDHIWLRHLLHGVCYSIPLHSVQRVLTLMPPHPEADFAIGMAWAGDVLYPVESLVQHRDGASVEKHYDGQPRTEPRVARKLSAPLMYDR
jgi:hypothetical protein